MGVTLWLVTRSPIMLMMALFSPLMMAGSAISDRRSGRKEYEQELSVFTASVDQFRRDLAQAQVSETAERRAASPDAPELAIRARRRLPELWERRPVDSDFLDLRVGVADQSTGITVAFGEGGDAELRKRVDELVGQHALVPNVPVRVRLTDVGAVGVTGDARAVEGLARWLICQVAVLHSPRDVVIAAALSKERVQAWDWIGWLPHVVSEASPLEGSHVAVGHEPSRDLLRRIARLADERRAENEGHGRTRRRRSVVLLVDDQVGVEPAVVDSLLANCREVDVAAVWLARERRDLPAGCGAIVELESKRAVGTVTWTTGKHIGDVSAEGTPLRVAQGIARGLAPVLDVSSSGADADIPRRVALVDLLELIEPDPQKIVARWRRAPRGDAIRAIIGATADGPFEVDLRADGPHALVAGTTGAGKSELLRSLVASLASSHPPNGLTFLLVDYKGGAAFRDCVRLPHCVGMVTDLDEHEVHRALVSLNAELKRRERVLADANVTDLLALERRDAAGAPPNLVIVVDEFATLAKEVPAFVEGVVDVAQRGRSLGVHVVLATQRPGNAVTDNIRANTNLRIALRVATGPESEDVIGAPDAARLLPSMHGRALARRGPNELIPFQVAYVGGRTAAGREPSELEISDLVFGRPTGPVEATSNSSSQGQTDLDVLVELVREAAQLEGIPRQDPPWLPPLPEAIGLDTHDVGHDTDDASVVLGVVDEPVRQRQVPYVLRLPVDGNLLVFGATGSGKTTLLRSAAVALAAQESPAELNIYGLDFAGRGLAGLEALPHCGSIVVGGDEERVGRLLALLKRAVEERSRRFAATGTSNLSEYRRAHPGGLLPRIVVLLDSYAGFMDAYKEVEHGAIVEALPRLVAEGRAAGIHFLITADRRQAVPTAIASVVTRRVILRMAAEEEYAALSLNTRDVRGAKLPPGRGFLEDGREIQLAVVGGSVEAEAQARALTEFAEMMSERYTGIVAAPVTVIPTDVPRADLPTAEGPLTALLGVEESVLAPFVVSFEDRHFTVLGPYRSGRTTALATLVGSARESTPGLRTHLIAPRRSGLLDLDGWDSIARGTDDCDEQVRILLDALLSDDQDGPPTLVVIDDAGELCESRSAGELEQLIKRGRDRNLRVLAALETGQMRHYAPWVRELRKDGHGILLDPNVDLDGDLLGVRLPRRMNVIRPPGRGFAVVDGVCTLVQVARD